MSSPVPEAQQALLVPKKLVPFELATIAVPNPPPTTVLVKLHSVGLNPVDPAVQKNGFIVDDYPAVLGWDAAGEVVKLGEGVVGFTVGDRVVFQTDVKRLEYGGFQQFALAEVDTLSKIPPGLSYDQAATIPLTCSTAYLLLCNSPPGGIGLHSPIDSPGAYAGMPFLVIGGSSCVGQFGIQLAKALGFSPIITTSSLQHTVTLKGFGATHVIDRSQSDDVVVEEVRRIVGDYPLTYVFDAIGYKETQYLGIKLVAPGGSLAIARWLAIKDEDIKEGRKVVTMLAVKHLEGNIENMRKLWENMEGLLKEGIVKPLEYRVLNGGLLGVLEGCKLLDSNMVSGEKLVVHPQET